MTAADLAPLEDKLRDPLWRMSSGELYKISPADGSGLQPFIPRPEQIKVLSAIVSGKKKILIPKARRLGMSTVLGIYFADCLLFRRAWQGSLIDQNAADASRKLDRIVRVALDNLPPWLQQSVSFPKSNDSQITVNMAHTGESSFYAGMNARGGSNDALWVSEWGVIQNEDPKRSAKIRSGALPSARHGVIVIETTWQGGKFGDVWELLEPSLTGQADDWNVLFFPWWVDPRNVNAVATIDTAATEYFAKIAPRLEKEGVVLSDAQRRWWAAERREQGVAMTRENPTFLDECWSAPVKGAVFAEKIEQARAEGRITGFPIDGSNLVNTSWDLGAPASMCVWYWQIVGREIRIIDCDIGDHGTLTERVAMMLAKGYNYGKHFLPHDAEQTERTGETFLGAIVKAGLPAKSISVVPRIHDVWIGINHALELFPALAFRSPQCDDGIDGLSAYRTRRQGEGAATTDEPVHDWSSHIADPFRLMAEAHRAGMVAFKHTTAEPRPDWHNPGGGRGRRGMKPQRVG